MRNLTRFTAAVALVGAAAATSALALPGGGNGAAHPTRGRSALAIPDVDPPDANAVGRIDFKYFPGDVEKERVERSWIRFRLRHLDKSGAYTVFADDPLDAVDGVVAVPDGLGGTLTLTMNGGGNLNFRLDSKEGAAMPFGHTLAELAGAAVEIHDVNGAVVLAGTFPTLE
jgi:hypothetical protein